MLIDHMFLMLPIHFYLLGVLYKVFFKLQMLGIESVPTSNACDMFFCHVPFSASAGFEDMIDMFVTRF